MTARIVTDGIVTARMPAEDAEASRVDGSVGRAPISEPEPVPRRRRRRVGLLACSILLVGVGIAFLTASIFAPAMVDKVTGDIKVGVQKQLQQIFAPDELPAIRLGAEGGMVELDHCDGTFTEMISYRIDGVPPLFAAHNNCGGDVILGWEIGQRVRVDGSDVVYEVVEERHTPKWSNVEELVGMSGEFMVQTCFYGENKMRFLALAPVGTQSDAG
ncbi:hypothetical protein [Microbacterium phyllosphaerae]|uniref:hypothetical protein n=1 Tax=Microbacterium phyllosphaerae TaxID=124798 RepID=UPI00216760CD|nr:hypothetical protein [Microbacterium phyllosphaerae]MCS3442368.1 hypothetical protein [Microbacterium phyllosphaerae]